MELSYVKELLVIFTLAAMVNPSICLDRCSLKTYDESGDMHFGVILSMHSAEVNGTCGEISYYAVQLFAAVKYVLKKLNSPGADGNTFIPGVKLGFTVYDDCGNDQYAQASAFEVTKGRFSPSIVDCNQQNSSVFAGIIGPSRSQSAVAVSQVLEGTQIPLIGVATTLSQLSDKSRYPNVMRTALSDQQQAQAIVALMNHLQWSVIAILHTTDLYGQDLASSVKELAGKNRICVLLNASVTMEDLDTVHSAISSLLEIQKSTVHGLGVVFLGQREAIKGLVRTLSDSQGVEKLKWIFPDTLGQNSEPLIGPLGRSDVQFLREVWSISPASLPLQEFGRVFQSEIDAAKSPLPTDVAGNHWMSEFIKTNCRELFEVPACTAFEQSGYTSAAIHATYAISMAARSFHQQLCKGQSGLCSTIRGKQTAELLNLTKGVSFTYSDLDIQHTVPEFANAGTTISFDENGDIRQSGADELYSIYQFSQKQFKKVGAFHENGSLTMKPPAGQPSQCGASCSQCVSNQQFIYFPGKILLAAFVSMHWSSKNDNPFECGVFRNEVHTVIMVESILYTVKKIRNETGKDIGAIIFDDCYNSLKAHSIVSKFFSGDIPLVDPVSKQVINLSRVIGVVGSESSAVSLPLAESFTKQRLPTITPMSTTPDYDDKGIYPYSLRTVISDRGTAKAIVAFIKNFGWEYINIVYSNNNYGYKAMRQIEQQAQNEKICVAKPIPIDVTPQEKHLISIVKTLGANNAKIVVYIGLEEDTKAFQNILKGHPIELVYISAEDWAISGEPYPGTEEVTAGSLLVLPIVSQLPWDDFPNYLVNLKPELTEGSLWFDRFWQKTFQCNLPGRFERQFPGKCNNSLRFSLKDAEAWSKQFRVVNTVNAVAALLKGAVKSSELLCRGEAEFACITYRNNPENVTKTIREIRLGSGSNSYRPFRDDGNGNLDFCFYNLQQQSGGSYEYLPIVKYKPVEKTLIWESERRVQFYLGGKVVTEVDGGCNAEEICKACQVDEVAPVTVTVSGPCEQDPILIAILTILCLVLILIIAMFVIMCWKKCRNKRRGKSEQKGDDRTVQFTPTQDGGLILYPASFQNGTSNYNYSTYSADVVSSRASSYNPQLDGPQPIAVETADEDPYLHAKSVSELAFSNASRGDVGNEAAHQTSVKGVDFEQDASVGQKDYIQLLDEEQTTPKLRPHEVQGRSDRYSILPNTAARQLHQDVSMVGNQNEADAVDVMATEPSMADPHQTTVKTVEEDPRGRRIRSGEDEDRYSKIPNGIPANSEATVEGDQVDDTRLEPPPLPQPRYRRSPQEIESNL